LATFAVAPLTCLPIRKTDTRKAKQWEGEGMDPGARERQRGVVVLVGVGLLAAGALVLRPEPAARAPDSRTSFVFSEVRVIAPTLRDASKVNINAADADSLATLPGIGEALAARIVAYRELHGPFARIEDLDAVAGIGPSVIERIRDLATVGDAPEGPRQ
jgi:competence ComEA-like helix-hairpin-helix protein